MTITRDKIIRVMGEVVDHVGEDHYNEFDQYFMRIERDGDIVPVPCCLVGHILVELGVDAEDWYGHLEPYNSVGIDALTVEVEQLLGDAIDLDGWDALLQAQHMADGHFVHSDRRTWSEIVERFTQ